MFAIANTPELPDQRREEMPNWGQNWRHRTYFDAGTLTFSALAVGL